MIFVDPHHGQVFGDRWIVPVVKERVPDVAERLEWIANYHEILNLPEVTHGPSAIDS